MGRKNNKIYAFYRGEVNVCDGTLAEIAEKTGLTVATVQYYSAPSYRRLLQERRDRGVGGTDCIEVVELEDVTE